MRGQRLPEGQHGLAKPGFQTPEPVKLVTPPAPLCSQLTSGQLDGDGRYQASQKQALYVWLLRTPGNSVKQACGSWARNTAMCAVAGDELCPGVGRGREERASWGKTSVPPARGAVAAAKG